MRVSCEPLAITGVGLITPVGHTAVETFASISSEITGLRGIPIPSRNREPLTGAVIHGVADEFVYERRLGELARMATTEAVAQAGLLADGRSLPSAVVFQVLPPATRPGLRWQQGGGPACRFLCPADKLEWRTVEVGHPGGIHAMAAASSEIEIQSERVCLIVAVDSLVQLRVLRWLESTYRLKTERNSIGLLPGEAAAAIILEHPANAARRGASPLCMMHGVGFGHEPATIDSDKPSAATGLTAALRAAISAAQTDVSAIDTAYCDMNGEYFRAQEWALAQIRALRQPHPEFRTLHPADSIGDVGAASAVVLTCLAATEMSVRRVCPATSLVVTSGEGHERAAMILASSPWSAGVLHRDDSASRSSFARRLYEEHIDDAGCLYLQRKYILRHAQGGWKRARLWERRLLRHIDAIGMGGLRAASQITRYLVSDDENEVFAAAISLLDAGYAGFVAEAIHEIKSEAVAGFRDALKHTRVRDLACCFPKYAILDAHLKAAFIEVRGYRREGSAAEFIEYLSDPDERIVAAAADSLGRTGDRASIQPLRGALIGADRAPRMHVVWALLRMDPVEVLDVCRSVVARGVPGAASVLALGGANEDWIRLRDAANPESIQALGWLGSADSIPALIDVLAKNDEDLRRLAAQALHRITGAPLAVQTPIEDEDSDTASVSTLSVDVTCWEGWLKENRARFKAGERYRWGAPFCLKACIDEMDRDVAVEESRRRAYLEFVIRSGRNIAFETDWFYETQAAALKKLAGLDWVTMF